MSALVLPVDDRGHQFVAAGEAPVDRGAAELRPTGDIVERDTAEPVSLELQHRGVEDRGGRVDRYGVTPSRA